MIEADGKAKRWKCIECGHLMYGPEKPARCGNRTCRKTANAVYVNGEAPRGRPKSAKSDGTYFDLERW